MSVFNRLKQITSVSTVAICISVAAVSQATAAERYIVSGVESWDTLNIRSEPSARSAIIGEIPSDGKGVNSTGQEIQNGRTTWAKVNWNGVNGWVSKRYLATDYTYTAPASTKIPKPNYIKTPDYADQGSERNGSIYDAGTGTVRSVYAAPGKGLPAIKVKSSTAGQYIPKATTSANTHSHPANQCTRSVSHTHPNGANQHTHRYSCQGQATQQPQVQVRAVNNANTHTHPRNQFTNAVTHTHASGSAQHQHNYGGQRQVQQQTQQVQIQTQNNANTHTHPRNQFTNAVTHTHASGNAQHQHNYGGQRQVQQQTQQAQVTTNSNLVTHIHPASPYNKQTQHTHAGGAGVHVHDFLLPPRQVATQAAQTQVSANTHTHPKNNLTNSVTHTHPNGANQHSHSYGR